MFHMCENVVTSHSVYQDWGMLEDLTENTVSLTDCDDL